MQKTMGFSLNVNLGSWGGGTSNEGSVLPEPDYAPGTNKRVLIDTGDTAVAALLPLIVGTMFAAVPAVMFYHGAHEEGLMEKVFMGVFGLLGLVGLYMGMMKLLVSMRFAPGRLAPSVWPLRLGESFTLEYQRATKTGAAVTSMTARIYLQESATYRQGTDTYTDTEVVYDCDLGSVGATQGGDGVYRGKWSVDIPGNSMASFEASDNQVNWMVEVKIFAHRDEIDDSSFKLVVLPEIAPSTEAAS